MKPLYKIVITAIICLAIGFVLGMEYKAYQVRSALQEGLNEISEAFNPQVNSNEANIPVKEIKIDKKIGDIIEFATIELKVNSLEEACMLTPSFGKPIVANTNAKFIILDVDITNITKTPFTHYDEGILLFDNQERIFEPYSSIGNIENYLAGRDLAPSITENGKMVYEVPKDSKEYHLVIAKGDTDETYYIKLN